MKKTLLMLTACLMLPIATALAQDYGVGETRVVSQVAPGDIVIDGEREDLWDNAVFFDLLENTDWWSDDVPDVDIPEAFAQAYFSNDTLYVYAYIDDNSLFTNEDELYESDQIVVGIDPVHEVGVTDQLVDENFSGWPDNAPDAGPYAYTIYIGEDGGTFTLNWGFPGIDPAAEGWVNGVVFTDEANQDWGIEAAFYVPGLEPGAEIGFNIGGGNASVDLGFGYGFFSTWSTEYPGGDIRYRTDSYATLQMAGGGGGDGEYGSGEMAVVPRVMSGDLTLDGMADEAAWGNALVVDPTVGWSGYGPYAEENNAETTPDIFAESRVLWSEDTLYVFTEVLAPELLFLAESPWDSDNLFVGIDPTHGGDTLFVPPQDFSGAPWNAPDAGPHTYFINFQQGFTLNWGFDDPPIVPEDSMWVRGTLLADEGTGEYTMEAAFHVPDLAVDSEIGFNIGGASAAQYQCDEFQECVYAYWAWQSSGDPGAINRDASVWATLSMSADFATSIEQISHEIPSSYTLEQNYPNPFNPSTTIEFGMQRAGHVTLEVFNTLGQRIDTLVDGAQPEGTHRVQWEADGLVSGVYLYQLRVDGDVVASRVMTLMK